MPVIARFYGLIIKMFLLGKEHNPPHIHISYGEFNALFDITTLEFIEGDLPPRAENLVKEWASLHQAELLEMWETQKFQILDPLH